MRWARQKALSAELNAFFPRGDLDQNIFRMGSYDLRLSGRTIEEAVVGSMAMVRADVPGFVPRTRA
jgi:hypothetical protein